MTIRPSVPMPILLRALRYMHATSLFSIVQDEDSFSDLERVWSQAERLAQSVMRNHRLHDSAPSSEMPNVELGSDPPSPVSTTRNVACAIEAETGSGEKSPVGPNQMFASSRPETLSRLPDPVSSPARRRPPICRRVASSSSLIGLEESSDVNEKAESANWLMSKSVRIPTCDWDEDLAIDTLFFSYYARLMEDAIKRVVARKRRQVGGMPEKQFTPEPSFRDVNHVERGYGAGVSGTPQPPDGGLAAVDDHSMPASLPMSPLPAQRIPLISSLSHWADAEEESSAPTESAHAGWNSELSGWTGRSPHTDHDDGEGSRESSSAKNEAALPANDDAEKTCSTLERTCAVMDATASVR